MCVLSVVYFSHHSSQGFSNIKLISVNFLILPIFSIVIWIAPKYERHLDKFFLLFNYNSNCFNHFWLTLLRFGNGDSVLNVLPMSKLHILSPNPSTILKKVRDNTPKDKLYENVWIVSPSIFKF